MLWIKYHRNGKSIRESTHTTEVKEAEKLLRQRLAAISTGTYVGLKLKKMRVSEPGEVSMTLLVKPLLSQCVHRRGSDEDVFTREDGKPVRDFRGASEHGQTPALRQKYMASSFTICGGRQREICAGPE